MLAAYPGTAIAPNYPLTATGGLADWQRFLQGHPIESDCTGVERSPLGDHPATVSVVTPIAETLEQLGCNWMTGLLATTCLTGSVAVAALGHLAQGPAAPQCERLPWGALARTQITCLQTAIAAGDQDARRTGLAWVGSWPDQFPLFAEGTDLLERWSIPVLHEARRARASGDLIGAIDLAAQIPPSSPRFTEAQTLLGNLRDRQQAQAADLYQRAQTALQQQDWATAFQQLWQLQALNHAAVPLDLPEALAQQIETERQAIRQWNQALQRWTLGTPADRGEAIAIASQIPLGTDVRDRIQPQLNVWSDEVLLIAQQRLAQQNWEGAIALTQQVARNSQRRELAQARLTAARAQQLAALSWVDDGSDLDQLVGGSAAILMMQSTTVKGANPLAIAQAHRWSQQLHANHDSAIQDVAPQPINWPPSAPTSPAKPEQSTMHPWHRLSPDSPRFVPRYGPSAEARSRPWGRL